MDAVTTGHFVGATSLDTIRIEVVGAYRAITCKGSVWVRLRDEHAQLLAACRMVQRTLALCRDPEANPLAKMCDKSRAEQMVAEAIAATEASVS